LVTGRTRFISTRSARGISFFNPDWFKEGKERRKKVEKDSRKKEERDKAEVSIP
jgi:hypothetical protein